MPTSERPQAPPLRLNPNMLPISPQSGHPTGPSVVQRTDKYLTSIPFLSDQLDAGLVDSLQLRQRNAYPVAAEQGDLASSWPLDLELLQFLASIQSGSILNASCNSNSPASLDGLNPPLIHHHTASSTLTDAKDTAPLQTTISLTGFEASSVQLNPMALSPFANVSAAIYQIPGHEDCSTCETQRFNGVFQEHEYWRNPKPKARSGLSNAATRKALRKVLGEDEIKKKRATTKKQKDAIASAASSSKNGKKPIVVQKAAVLATPAHVTTATMDTETSYLQSLPNSSPILKFSSPSPSLTTPSAASFQQSSAIILTSSAISPALSTLTTKLSRKRDFEDEESLAPPRKKIAEESKCTTSPRPISKPMTSHQKTPKLASLSGPCSPIPNFLPIPSYIIGEITLSTMDYTSISPLFGYSDMLNF